jgi:hypothetical protein
MAIQTYQAELFHLDARSCLSALSISFFILTGCGTPTKELANTPATEPVTIRALQNDCEKEHASIRDVVDCLVQAANSRKEFAYHADRDILDLYFSYGYAFADKVKAGVLTEQDAALGWKESGLRLDAIERSRMATQSTTPTTNTAGYSPGNREDRRQRRKSSREPLNKWS